MQMASSAMMEKVWGDEVDDFARAISHIKANDFDGDGVPDEDDACPNSILDPTVVIDGCDSQVSNTVLSDGCSISDEVDECAANGGQHEEFQSCVSDLAGGIQVNGVLSGPETDQIMGCTAQVDLP